MTGINLVQNKDRARRQSRPPGHEGHAAGAEEDGGEGAELEPDAALQPGPHEVGCEELHQRHVVEQPRGGGVQQAGHDQRRGAVLPVHLGERQPQRDPERRRRREEEHQPGPHLEAVLRLQDAAAEPHPLEQLVEAHGRHQRPDRAHARRRANAQADHHRVHDDAHLKDLQCICDHVLIIGGFQFPAENKTNFSMSISHGFQPDSDGAWLALSKVECPTCLISQKTC